MADELDSKLPTDATSDATDATTTATGSEAGASADADAGDAAPAGGGDVDLSSGQVDADPGVRAAAAEIQLVVLPIACTNEGKGAPLAMGIQRWWAQELALSGYKAAAPVFTALQQQGNRRVPALMVFREAWTDTRALDGMGQFPNATHALALDLHVDDEAVRWSGRLLTRASEGLSEVAAFAWEGQPAGLPAAVFEVEQQLAERFGVTIEPKSWSEAFDTENVQALLSFLIGLGNLSALQGRCVPTTPDNLLSPLVDALNRDAGMDVAMQALHTMVDILVQNPIDQTAVPLSLQALNVAAQRRREDPNVFHHLGLLFRRLGDVGSAVQAFNQAFNLEPTNAALAQNFIAALRSAGDNANALKVAQFAVERGNESPVVLAQLGSLLIDGDKFDDAEPFLRRAVEEGQVPSAYGDLANVLWDRSDDDAARAEDRAEALGLMRSAIDLAVVHKSTLDMLLDLHDEENLGDATELLLEAAAKHPQDATVQRYAAQVHLGGDDPSKARPYLERILTIGGRTLDDDAFARRARLTLDMDDFEGRYERAVAQVRSGKPEAQTEAAKFLREVIAAEPRFWQPHFMLALAVRGPEGDAAALAHLNDAVRLRPNDGEIRNLLAAILRKQGRPREAVEHLRAVVALNPRDIPPVVMLATCMRDANMFEEARQVCSAALQMLPNHPEFKAILDSLPAPKR